MDSDGDSDNIYDFSKKYRKLLAESKKRLELAESTRCKRLPMDDELEYLIDTDAILESLILKPKDKTTAKSKDKTITKTKTKTTAKSKDKAITKTKTKTTAVPTSTVTSSTTSDTNASLPYRNLRSSSINSPATTSASISNCGPKQQTKKRKRGEPKSNHTVIGPVICIGDFDDGYPTPPPKTTKTIPSTSVISVDDDFDIDNMQSSVKPYDPTTDIDIINRVMNIKVYWLETKRVHMFPLRRYQSIESIYEYFGKLIKIKPEDIYLELNGMPLFPTDSPDSINYSIAQFIDGSVEMYISPREEKGILMAARKNAKLPDDEINFRIIQKNVKRPLFMNIKKTDKMLVLYVKLSEKLGFDIDSFTLEFDGDKIQIFDTIETFDFEGDECIELFKKNVDNN